MPQRGELARVEARARTGCGETLENALIETPVDAAAGEQPLERQAIVHLATQDAGAVQLEQVIDEHLRGGEQAGREGLSAAFFLEERRVRLGESRARAAPAAVLLMAQQQRIHYRSAELADADLQRTAIAHQAAHVQANGMLDRADRRVRRTE